MSGKRNTGLVLRFPVLMRTIAHRMVKRKKRQTVYGLPLRHFYDQRYSAPQRFSIPSHFSSQYLHL